MARVTYGSLVTELRGSIGGTTFQRNRFGFTAKNKSSICLPQSQDQQQSKSFMAAVAQNWLLLSEEQRALFNTYASLYPSFSFNNPTIALSGYNIYNRWEFLRLKGGYALENDISLSTEPIPQLQLTLQNTVQSRLIINMPDTETNSFYTLISISPPLKASVNFNIDKVRWFAAFNYAASTIDITELYLAKFGVLPQVGEAVLIKQIVIGRAWPQYGEVPSYKTIVVEEV